MDHIETKILNSYTIQEAAQNMVFAARLTQQGHSIQNMDDLMALYQKSFTDKTVDRIASLPHPTVQKFTVITVAIVGASRRFLAQITRHQNEVKFMSASLQYSNYSEKAAFAIPYEILFSEQRYIDLYLKNCRSDCQSSPPNRTEIYGDYRCDCRCKQTFSCTDHSSSKRSKIHECISAI